MNEIHKVRLGDHLERIAASHRFRSYAPLWNDPDNRELRKRRGTPHILASDDAVSIPELNVREVDRPTEKRHRFVAEVHQLKLRLLLHHWDGRPLEDKPAEVLLDGKPAVSESQKPGGVEVPIAPTTDRGIVKLPDHEITTRIGFLQPADTPAGWRERLNNLGYLAGDSDDLTKLQFRSAIEEFQCDHDLVVDGKFGPQTKSALVRAHGC